MNDLPIEIWEDVPDWVMWIAMDSNGALQGYHNGCNSNPYNLRINLDTNLYTRCLWKRPQSFKTPN